MSINLMPWRQERRKKLQKDFATKIGFSALLGASVVVLGIITASSLISGQKNRISYLEENIATAEKDIEEIKTLERKKAQMLGRKNVIERLQANRDQLPNIMYQLAYNIIDGVTINSVTVKNNVLSIEGKATSNSAVASYITNLKQSPWFKNPEIIIIQNEVELAKGKQNLSHVEQKYTYIYKINSGIVNPNAPKVEETEAPEPAADKNKRNRNRK